MFEWAMRRAGVEWGDRLPRWGIALNLLLFPSRIRLWIGSSFYDAATDTINLRGVRLSVHGLESMFGQPSRPGRWFRVESVTDGLPTIECRVDGYTVPATVGIECDGIGPNRAEWAAKTPDLGHPS